MPPPHSEHAPYFSQKNVQALKQALNEYEALADSCRLTDRQKVKTTTHYVPPFRRAFWKLLSGYDSGNWPLYRRSLEDFAYARTRDLRELYNFVQRSSKVRITQEEEVHQYYQEFVALSQRLVRFCWLTEDYRDAMFWCGFHPDDRVLFFPLLEVKCPFQPEELAFNYEDVFEVAIIVLAGIPSPEQRVRNDEHGPPPELEHQLARQPGLSTPDVIPIPTRPVIPCPHSERPPGLCRPVAISPLSQQFNNPVDMDAGPLVGTPSDSSPTSLPALSPPLPPSDSFPVFSLSPSPLVPASVHSPLPPDSFLVPSLCTPLPARSPPLSDLPPTSSPLLPTPLPTHSPPLTDPLPAPLRPPPLPIPAHSPLPSGLLPTSSPPLPSHVHPPSSPPPPSLLLTSPEQAVNPALMSRRNPPLSPFTVSTNLCSPRPSQSPPTLPISPAPPRLPPPRPPDTTPADSADSERPLPPPPVPPALSCAKAIDTMAAPRKENHSKNAYPSLDAPSHRQHSVRTATLTAAIGTSTREDPAVAV
ncbi:hypothetical protein EDB85DRAFT_2154176 [Lactarius pseudohatsudake]|nr:hypothetical protein EDB85DRAFT_2154176 [Lactarius pseudohatsudake]